MWKPGMHLRQLLKLFLLLRLLHQGTGDDDKKEVLVKEVVLDSAVVDIVYLGQKHECLLVTTKSKRLYYSQDSGQTWSEITDKVDKSGKVQLQVERIIVSPTDKTVAVLQTNRRTRLSSDADDSSGSSSYGKWWPYVYVTEDSGQTWRRAWGKKHGLHSWIAHPTLRTWALVSWWSGDCNTGKSSPKKDEEEETEDDKKPCVHRLMFTKDLGRNFLQLAEYVVQFSWGSTSTDQTNRVYFTAYRAKTGDQGRLSLWTTEVDFHYVDILKSSGRPKGSTVECLRHGNKFLVSSEFVLVAKVNDETQQTVHLMVSKDGGKSFKAALLPSGMGELEEKWYTVLDTSEGTVILHINSNAGVKDAGRIFVSDDAGYKYSQSLVNNVRSAQGECEFDKVVSLQGVYLANTVVPDGPTDQSYRWGKERAAEDVEKEAANGAEVDQKHGRGFSKGKASKAAKEERTIRTVISFDKGGAWRNLKAPKVNSLGKAYECEGKPAEECSLHLHGTTSWDFYAPFYSSESAVGIIMGTGNVGPRLRFEPEETSTFLSRDGGLTWLEAHKGAYIYEFGDHGGLIVMADDLKKTTEVIFSWNEGESWLDFKVSSTPFEVDNIITEPNVTATTFIMFGTREEGIGVIYYLRFDTLKFPVCKGAWAADSVSSDYETWTPSDGVNSEKCLLGQQVTYTRRKRTSQCWNGETFERPVGQKGCSCTQADYSCDIGFIRGVNQIECLYGGSEMMPERFIPASCSKTFTASAYRKVAGDHCEGGFKPAPVQVPCRATGLQAGHFKYGLLGVLVFGIAYYFYNNSGSAGGAGKPGFGEFAAKTRLPVQPMELLQFPIDGARWLHGRLLGSRGFHSYGGVSYKRVQGDDFDMDGMGVGNEELLTDFIDEAEHDDSAPRVYSSSLDDRKSHRNRREDDKPSILQGGAQAARHEVPKLQAPPTIHGKAAPEQFNISDGIQDDLL